MPDANLSEKPSFGDWIRKWAEEHLPFQLPTLPLPQTAKNLDKAAAKIVLAVGDNVSARLKASTKGVNSRASEAATLSKIAQVGLLREPTLFEARAVDYVLEKALEGQANRESILKLAFEDVSDQPPTADADAEIDSDWLDRFAKFASEKSNEDVQKIWAKILAGEIRQPGSSSLRTLEFLSTVTSAEAERIVRIFKYAINPGWIPRYVSSFEKGMMPYEDLHFCDEIGLITGGISIIGNSNITLNSVKNDSFDTGLSYGKKASIIVGNNSKAQINIQVFPFSRIAKEIFGISDNIEYDYSFFEEFFLSLSSEAAVDKIFIGDALRTPSNKENYSVSNLKEIFTRS